MLAALGRDKMGFSLQMTKDQIKKEALAVAKELLRDHVLTLYQYRLFEAAILSQGSIP